MMYICVATRTRTERNEKTNKLEPVITRQAHIEEDVSQQLELMQAGDDRVASLRIFHMGFDDDGVPAVGTEVTA